MAKCNLSDETLSVRRPNEPRLVDGASINWVTGASPHPPGRPLSVMREFNERLDYLAKHTLVPDAVPLAQWRGRKFMTMNDSVHAQCARCELTWRLDGTFANTVADAQGIANRLIRRGSKMEQFGATFTAGASGRRIAAGNEAARHDQELGSALSLAACPACHSVDKVELRL